jgi:predicted amidophosphoribosyltransferase
MIFNCLSCGKAISSLKDICPYCKTDISSINEKLNRQHNNVKLINNKLKGTILAFIHKKELISQ